MEKKKSNMPFLFWAMGHFKICMIISIVLAAFSAIASIMAYTNVYGIVEEILLKTSEGTNIDGDRIAECGRSIVFMVCMGYGLYEELMAREGIYKNFVSERREAASWKIA